MFYHDEDDINDRLEEDYYEWLEENFSMLQIEEGEVPHFDEWLNDKKQFIADCYADDYFEEHLA